MRGSIAWLAGLVLATAAIPALAADEDRWAGYLDYAYVYSSAAGPELGARLQGYAAEAGSSLERYIATFEAEADAGGALDEARTRRKAIAYLLDYLARGEPESLDKSVDQIEALDDRLGRHENRYWYHYIRAHRALERGRRFDFVMELLDLWRSTVVPLESTYDTLQTLSLDDAPNSGFASALPFVYENVARLILLRGPELGLIADLDALGAIVRLLHDGRVGGQPEVIPVDASSVDYLDRIVARLDGPESDAGSLSFTLALFEASKYHDQARALLASEGLTEPTLEAIRVTSGAYRGALDLAVTTQGECAVYTRVLRQIGELYAARQRLGEDPDIDTPFHIEDAIGVYGRLHRGLENEGWLDLGYALVGKPAYLSAMRGLWEEIQEASLNGADYYLSQSVAEPHRANENARNAARLYSRYLAFFQRFATRDGKQGVPESAYFAAHEAAKGIGDAYLLYASHPTSTEVALAVRSYRTALRIFPFDRRLWSGLAAALEHQGRESDYSGLVRPAADSVTRSRSVDTWIERREPEAERIAVLRRAFGDSLALVYLGFAEAEGLTELENSLDELRVQRQEARSRLEELESRKREGGREAPPAAPDPSAPRGPDPVGPRQPSPSELAEINRRIAETHALLERVEHQIAARERTLPLFEATLATDGLSSELRARRDHPLHTLLRRMYFENRNPVEEER